MNVADTSNELCRNIFELFPKIFFELPLLRHVNFKTKIFLFILGVLDV